MAQPIKIVLNRAGVRDYMRSESVKADLKRRAEAVREKAGEGYELEEADGKNRARVNVFTETLHAKRIESKHGNLRRSIGG